MTDRLTKLQAAAEHFESQQAAMQKRKELLQIQKANRRPRELLIADAVAQLEEFLESPEGQITRRIVLATSPITVRSANISGFTGEGAYQFDGKGETGFAYRDHLPDDIEGNTSGISTLRRDATLEEIVTSKPDPFAVIGRLRLIVDKRIAKADIAGLTK